MQTKTNTDCGLSQDDIIRIQQVFASCPRLKKAILFGSRAMGTHRPGSDIDIALDGEELTIQDQLRLMGMIDELNLPNFFDLILLKQVNNQDLISHINRVGKIIYSNK
ncbi:nucleotidyltransferase domain-containing protein [Methanospirillum stamsii]|nr:nucleotidyltransferase domain-containing protein [Methanospirillum stamsii]